MAIATALEVNWHNTVDATNKIGLSDTLNNLGVDVFDSVDFCLGFENPALKLTKESDGYPKSTDPDANNVAYYISNNIGYSLTGVNNPNGAYYRTLLFAVPPNWSWGWDRNLRSNNTDVRIVTKLDLSKNKAYLTTNETAKDECVQHGTPTYLVNESLEGTNSNGTFYIGNSPYHIECGNIYKTDNGYYVKFSNYIDPLYDNFNANYGEGAAANFNYDINSSKMFSASPAMFNNDGWIISLSTTGPGIYYMPSYNETEIEVPPDANNSNLKLFGTYTRNSSFYWRVNYEKSVEYWLWIIASYGMYFDWNGTDYKPIITDGYLKGYTDDMSVESDIDNWTDITGHNVPSGPPAPPTPPFPEGDEWDAINRGPVGVGGAGLLKVYAMSLDELASFSDWMNSVDSGSGYDGPPEGFNVIDSIIGLSQYPVNFTGGTQTTLVFTNSAADPEHRVINSHCNANRLTGVGTTQHFSLGSITIDRKFSNDTQFLDYDTLVEVYIPFCGIFTVDTQVVMGRTLTGDIWVDPVTGGCYAEIDCSLDTGGTTPIIMAEGNMGIEMPITSTQYSMSVAAQATNRNSYIAGAIGSVFGAAITAVAGGLAGGAKAAGAVGELGPATGLLRQDLRYSGFRQGFTENLGRQGIGSISGAVSNTYNAYRTNKLLQAANNTAVKGGLGSSFAVWAQPWNAYVKITRYNKQVPGNYNHTVGVPVVMNKTIGEYSSGDYIVCVNPDLSGFEKATPEELSQIYAALTSGVYV